MAITYPITLPVLPQDASIAIATNNSIFVSPNTRIANVQENAGDRFTLTMSFPPLNQYEASQLQGFVGALKGQIGQFYFGDPLKAVPNGVATGSPVINGENLANSSVLNIKGFTPSTADILMPGDYIQLGVGNTSFLHQVIGVSGYDSDVSGEVTVDIHPKLKRKFNDSEVVVTHDTVGRFQILDANNLAMTISTNIYSGLVISAEQVMN